MSKHTKKWGSALLAAGILAGAAVIPVSYIQAASTKQQATTQQAGITIQWNGKASAAKGIQVNGNTMIPVAALRDSLGIPVSYDTKTATYTVGSGYNKLYIMASSSGTYVNVNGINTRSMDAKQIAGKIYIPMSLLKDYLGIDAQWNAVRKTVTLSKSQLNPITIASQSLPASSNAKVSYKVKYPQISGNQLNPEAQQAINSVLKKHAEGVMAAGKKMMAEGEATTERPYEFGNDFAIAYNKDGILSVIMQDYSYTGGAHGMTARKGYTFSLADGKLLQLSDVLKANPNYKKFLNADLKKKIDALQAGEGFGKFKELAADQNFYVTSSGVTIVFDLYDYAPYAYGIPEFTYSFAQLLPQGGKPFAGQNE
ncbi:PdaC/SigV domain-containing protein [Paenibacillus sp. TY11]|uniref:PdaC/SigV domain-containing protein n=1 Tax=Paenibacillus sp. TY11 TaxID=3448633 RepID=UPI004039FA34